MIDILSPINSAYERTQKLLFPIKMDRWIPLSFGAFLICPIIPMGTNIYPNHYGGLAMVLYSILATIALAFSVFLMWLNARGRFMFLNNLLQVTPSITEPWVKHASQANWLFLFNIILFTGFAALSFLTSIPFLLFPDVNVFHILFYSLYGTLLSVLFLPILALYLSFFHFGPPLMYKRGLLPWSAFRITSGFLLKDPVGMLSFFLMMFCLEFSYFVALLFGILFTFLLLGGIIAIPFIGNLVVLPISVFFQSYTLDVLAQFGPQYDLWSPASAVQ